MHNKFLNTLLFIAQLLITALCLAVAVRGIFLAQEFPQELPFLQVGIRIIMLLVFTISYYKSSITGGNPGNIFLLCFILSASLAELRVFDYFSSLTQIRLLSVTALSRISIFSVTMMFLSLIGSGIYFQNNEHGAVSLFTWVSVAAAVFLSLLLPTPLSYSNLWKMTPSFWIVVILSIVAVIVNLLLLFIEPLGTGTIKLLSSLLFVIGTFLICFFVDEILILAGTGAFVVGCLLNTIVLTRNAIRL